MKNKFIKSTLILILGGIITKLLSMIIKIFLTRTIKESGIGLYMTILPTFNLFITLSTLSLTTSISSIISKSYNKKKAILSLIPITIIYNFILMFILLLISKLIAIYLLKNNQTYYPILSIALTLPFISLSSILKGYFHGTVNMTPYIISNIVEQIIRLLCIIYLVPMYTKYGIEITCSIVVLINIISELSSIIVLIIYLPKSKINIHLFYPDKQIIKDILNISIPATGSRLIGSISYFLEPIILTTSLIYAGYSNQYITDNYGIITGYVYPLLLMPSFFTMSISTSLLPLISNSYKEKKYKYLKNKLKIALGLSLLLGITSTFIFIIFGKYLLNLIYNTNLGLKYLKIIAPFFIFHYIQSPLTAYLQGINKAKTAMQGTLLSSIIKNILLAILPIFIGIWGFIISTICNIIIVTIHHIYYTYKSIKGLI